MEIFGNALDLLETILTLVMLVLILWGTFEEYKWKGVIAVIAGLTAVSFAIFGLKKMMDCVFDNHPNILITVLVLFAIIMIIIMVNGVITQYNGLKDKDKPAFLKKLKRDFIISLIPVAAIIIFVIFVFLYIGL